MYNSICYQIQQEILILCHGKWAIQWIKPSRWTHEGASENLSLTEQITTICGKKNLVKWK